MGHVFSEVSPIFKCELLVSGKVENKKTKTFEDSVNTKNWLVVEPTHMKNISQIGSFPQIGVNIKNIWNQHPEKDVYGGSWLKPVFTVGSEGNKAPFVEYRWLLYHIWTYTPENSHGT